MTLGGDAAPCLGLPMVIETAARDGRRVRGREVAELGVGAVEVAEGGDEVDESVLPMGLGRETGLLRGGSVSAGIGVEVGLVLTEGAVAAGFAFVDASCVGATI